YPWREFAFDELRAGRMPFLNPYNGAGAPLMANYQTAILYPPNWLIPLLGDTWAMNWIAVLHVFWAGLGMWLLTAQLGATALGRGVGMMAYALGGYGIARMGSFPTANAVAWLPWLFWCVHQVMFQRRLEYVGLLGLVSGMLLLTGHAQTAFYALIGAGLFTLWGVWWWVARSARLRVLMMSAGGVALGGGIAMVQ